MKTKTVMAGTQEVEMVEDYLDDILETDEDRELRGAEKNDCVVVAVAYAFGVPYSQAHRAVEEHFERPQGKGCPNWDDHHVSSFRIKGNRKVAVLRDDGLCTYYKWPSRSEREDGMVVRQMTIGTFLKKDEFKKGTYLLGTNGHVFTIKDGVVLSSHKDATSPRARIQSCHQVKYK